MKIYNIRKTTPKLTAIQWTGDNYDDVVRFFVNDHDVDYIKDLLNISLEVGTYLIKHGVNDLSTCSEKELLKNYEIVSETYIK